MTMATLQNQADMMPKTTFWTMVSEIPSQRSIYVISQERNGWNEDALEGDYWRHIGWDNFGMFRACRCQRGERDGHGGHTMSS